MEQEEQRRAVSSMQGTWGIALRRRWGIMLRRQRGMLRTWRTPHRP
jgi:hypothetical protein